MSSSDSSSDDHLDYLYDSESSYAGSDNSSTDDASDKDDDRSNKEIDLNAVSFCATHKPGKMIKSCSSCSVALKMVPDRTLVARLFGDSSLEDDTTSGVRTRYMGRCDETVPTMSLSDDVLETVADIFGQGQFKGRSTWHEIVKKYLVLPQSQQDKLTEDLKSEDVFNKFRKQKKFGHIFKYQGEVRDCLKNFRISERPIFSVVQLLNLELSKVRKFGKDIGLSFPVVPPSRSGANVPRDRGEGTAADSLKFDSKVDIIPCPELLDFLHDVDLDRDTKKEIFEIMENYRDSLGDKIVEFYNSVSVTLNQIDDYLIFHFDLFSHVNASMKGLIRAKLASLFKSDIRDEILSMIRKADKSSNGIFGGEKKIRAALSGATKSDSVLNKAVISYGKPSSKRSANRRDGDDTRSRSRSRSPARPRSRSPPSREKADRSGYGYRKFRSSNKSRKRKQTRGSTGGSSNMKQKSDKS